MRCGSLVWTRQRMIFQTSWLLLLLLMRHLLRGLAVSLDPRCEPSKRNVSQAALCNLNLSDSVADARNPSLTCFLTPCLRDDGAVCSLDLGAMAHHLRWASTSKLTLTSTASSSSGLLSGQPGWRGNAPFTLPSSTRTLSTPTPAPVTLPFHASPRGISSAVGRQVAGGVNKPRLLHTTAPRRDHYSTLDISPQASQKDIKAQFYKVSRCQPKLGAMTGKA